MGKYLIDESTLTALGDAIRAKTGDSNTLSPAEMISAIENIQSNGGSGIGRPIGKIYRVAGYDSSAFYFTEDPHWQVGDWIYLKSGDKIGIAKITADWGGGEYVTNPNYCVAWGADGDTTLNNATIQKFELSTPDEAKTATIEFHDGSPSDDGPPSFTITFTEGQTWRDIAGDNGLIGSSELVPNYGYGNCIALYYEGLDWQLLNVQADDPIQNHIYLAIYF